MSFTALFDSCVLYSAQLRDLLLTLARMRMFRARWTETIHEEWIRNLAANREDIKLPTLQRLRLTIDRAVPNCLITGYETLIQSIVGLPDENDRHVVAAAVRGRVDVIVTCNIADFPKEMLQNRYDIDVQSPDEFISHVIDLDNIAVREAVLGIIQRLNNPPMTIEEYLRRLEKDHNLKQSVSMLHKILVGAHASPAEQVPPD